MDLKLLKPCSMVLSISFFFVSSLYAQIHHEVELKDLEETLSNAVAGDSILLKEGVYHDITLDLHGDGGSDSPIIIDGLDKVTLKGESSIVVTGQYVQLKNMVFSNIRAPENPPQYFAIFSLGNYIDGQEFYCKGCQLVSSVIKDPIPGISERYEFVRIIGSDNRLIRNVFSGRRHRAPVVHIWKANNTIIDSNSIYKCQFIDNHSNRAYRNGGEQIIVGTDGRAHKESGAVISSNSFDNVTGDDEIISIKSSGVTIYKNTITNSCGAISLRNGNSNRVIQNSFSGLGFDEFGRSNCKVRFPGSNHREGISISGMDHTIDRNEITNVDLAIAIRNGELPESDEAPLNHAYHPVENLIITNNEIIDVKRGLDINYVTMGAYSRLTNILAKDIYMSNNRVVIYTAGHEQ